MHVLIQHAMEDCKDPDCEIHQIENGIEEETISPAMVAAFICGLKKAQTLVYAIYGPYNAEAHAIKHGIEEYIVVLRRLCENLETMD